MTRLAMSAFREELSDVVSQVAFGKDPIVIQRSGKDIVAVVPMEDLALLEELEDRYLIRAADEAEAKSAGQPLVAWEDAKRELGW